MRSRANLGRDFDGNGVPGGMGRIGAFAAVYVDDGHGVVGVRLVNPDDAPAR